MCVEINEFVYGVLLIVNCLGINHFDERSAPHTCHHNRRESWRKLNMAQFILTHRTLQAVLYIHVVLVHTIESLLSTTNSNLRIFKPRQAFVTLYITVVPPQFLTSLSNKFVVVFSLSVC